MSFSLALSIMTMGWRGKSTPHTFAHFEPSKRCVRVCIETRDLLNSKVKITILIYSKKCDFRYCHSCRFRVVFPLLLRTISLCAGPFCLRCWLRDNLWTFALAAISQCDQFIWWQILMWLQLGLKALENWRSSCFTIIWNCSVEHRTIATFGTQSIGKLSLWIFFGGYDKLYPLQFMSH